jgi:peroxisomal membrane protein 2
MALYGLLFYGPSNHAWQRLLVHLFHGGSGGGGGLFHTLKAAAQRVALDQLTFAPLNNSLMIAYVAVVADRLGWAAARDKVRRELPGVQARGWRFWPAVQAVNQTAVPLRVRAPNRRPPLAGLPSLQSARSWRLPASTSAPALRN